MSKVIKRGDNKLDFKKFSMESFGESSSGGESAYNLIDFSHDELTVQESSDSANFSIGERFRNAMSDDGAPLGRVFGSRSFGEDEENEALLSAPKAVGKQNTPSNNSGFSAISHETVSIDDVTLPKSQKDFFDEVAGEDEPDTDIETGSDGVAAYEGFTPSAISQELNEKLAALTTEVANLTEENTRLAKELEAERAKSTELAIKLKALQDSVPSQQSDADKAGYDRAVKELENRDIKQYEAQQADYIGMLENNWQDVSAKLGEIKASVAAFDKEIPELIIGYVQHIIGKERMLNDKIINNVIELGLKEIANLQDVSFVVNPDDKSVVTDKYPDYKIDTDPSIPKGSVTLRTNIGETHLDVDSWLKELEQQLDEQFRNIQNS